MAKNPTLKVDMREITGRRVKQLRRQNLIPANIFGNKVKSTAVQVNQGEFKKVFEEAGETSLIDLSIAGESKKRPVLVSNLHRDPVTDAVLHVDFHQVDLTQKVTAEIPLEFIGESPAVKEKGGVLNQAFLELEVEALPADLPEHLEVDLSGLNEIGDSIFVKNISVSEKVQILLEPDTLIASVIEQEVEPEPEVIPEEGEAAEAEVKDAGEPSGQETTETTKAGESA